MSFYASESPSPISTTLSSQGPKHRSPDYRYSEKEKSGCCCGRKYRDIFPKDGTLVATKPIFKGEG